MKYSFFYAMSRKKYYFPLLINSTKLHHDTDNFSAETERKKGKNYNKIWQGGRGRGEAAVLKKLIMMVTVSGQKTNKTQERTKKQSERDRTETKETKLDPPAPKLSLAEAATSIISVVTKHIFRRDKSMLVATKLLSRQTKQNFVATKVLSRQAFFCRNKHILS